eukprot:6668303-Ditylum_brightwellii.AAC.1
MPPSRQFCTQWAVNAWDAISEESIKNAWVVCGYKSIEELINIPSIINDTSSVFANHDLQIAQHALGQEESGAGEGK